MLNEIKSKTKDLEENVKVGQKMDSGVESCVNSLMADKNFKPRGGEDKKTAAVKVCRKSILRLKALRNKLG